MMRKTYKCSLLALSVLASFTSCSESESLQQANLSDDKITFQPSLDNSWKPLSPSSSSRAAKDAANEEGPIVVPTSYGKPLYLHSLEQDGIYIWNKDGKRITRSGALLADGEQERAAQTRGAKKDNINDYGSFGVTAIYKEGNTNVSLFQKDGNPEIAVATPSNNFWGIQDSRWPNTGEVSFHAFAPYNAADNSLAFNQDIANGKTQITYTASNTDIASQPDLIVATNKGSKSKVALGLNFYHALTAVTFSVNKNLPAVVGSGKQLTKIELQGIYNKGICDLSLSGTANVPNAVWTLDKNNKVTYTFDVTDKNIIVGQQDYALTLGDQTLMMIPQTLETGAKVCFTLTKGGQTETLETNLTGEWKAGTTVNYNLSADMFKTIGDNIYYDTSWNLVDQVPDNSWEYYKNDPKNSFEIGDQIGVYVVNKYNELVVENFKLTRVEATQQNNYNLWEPENGEKLLYSKSCRYFCYYPYSASKQNVAPTAPTAEAFFADKINNLQLVTDQSTKEKFQSADFQAGSFVADSYGSFTVKMKHLVGFVILNIPSSRNKTLRFKDDGYKYYYGENVKRPESSDFEVSETFLHKTDPHYFPSRTFVGNKPYVNDLHKHNDLTALYRCGFIVPFGKTVKFQAQADPAEQRLNTCWGYLQDISATLASNNPIVKKDIECDVPGAKITRLYLSQREAVEEFDIPEVTEYTLSCWGATGTSLNNGTVSAAGFAKATWTSSASDKKLYICVGNRSGYNNGKSKGYDPKGGWGGGAAHIATSKQGNGETYNYENYKNDLLMVSGGSGAASFANASKPSGYGGGASGGTGRTTSSWDSTVRPQGGTQSGPGRNTPSNATLKQPSAFGIGGYALNNNIAVQGGSGFYGGGGGFNTHNAGGGSGYMNTSRVQQVKFLGGNESNGYEDNPDKNKLGACQITWTYHRPATLK